MKLVIQRVKKATVTIDGRETASIGHGLLVLAGIHQNDNKEIVSWCCDKLTKLRIFEDDDGKMNRSVADVEGELLIVSQFTLYGNTRKGTRPSFIEAAHPEIAKPLYQFMIDYLKRSTSLNVEKGIFGAMMDVELINSGPVTIILDKE